MEKLTIRARELLVLMQERGGDFSPTTDETEAAMLELAYAGFVMEIGYSAWRLTIALPMKKENKE